MRGGAPEPLEGALLRTLKALKLDARLEEAKAIAMWPIVAGPVTAAKTRAVGMVRGTLTVQTASAVWSNELSLLRPKLIAKFDELLRPGLVKDLRFVARPPRDAAFVTRGKDRGMSAWLPPDPLGLPEDARRRIAEAIGPIKDLELAARVRKAAEAAAGRQKPLAELGWKPCTMCGTIAPPAIKAPGGPPLCPPCRASLPEPLRPS